MAAAGYKLPLWRPGATALNLFFAGLRFLQSFHHLSQVSKLAAVLIWPCQASDNTHTHPPWFDFVLFLPPTLTPCAQYGWLTVDFCDVNIEAQGFLKANIRLRIFSKPYYPKLKHAKTD